MEDENRPVICGSPSAGPLQPTDRIPIAAIVPNELQGTLRLVAAEVEGCQSQLEPSLLLPLALQSTLGTTRGTGKGLLITLARLDRRSLGNSCRSECLPSHGYMRIQKKSRLLPDPPVKGTFLRASVPVRER